MRKYKLSELVCPLGSNKHFVKHTMEPVSGVIVSNANYNTRSWGFDQEGFLCVNVETHSGYINGVRHGKTLSWYYGGQLKESVIYKNGEIDGIRKSWYTNGVQEIESNYINGIKDGEHKEWFRFGGLESIENFKNGVNHGIHIRYATRKAVPKDVSKYSFIDIKHDSSITNYCIVYSCNFIQGEKDGVEYFNFEERYNPCGDELSPEATEVNYAFGIKDGLSRSWRTEIEHLDEVSVGYLLRETIYKKGLMYQNKWFFPNGNLGSEEIHEKGEPKRRENKLYGKSFENFPNYLTDGGYTQWYENGQISHNSKTVKNGLIHFHWHPCGGLCCEMQVKNKKIWSMKCYNDKGSEIKCSQLKIGENPVNHYH